MFAQGTMKLLAPCLKIINNLRKRGCCFVFPAMSVEKRTVLRDLLPTEPSRDDAALSLETCLTPARCAHYSLTRADIRPEVYFCSRSSQTEESLLIFIFLYFLQCFFLVILSLTSLRRGTAIRFTFLREVSNATNRFR